MDDHVDSVGALSFLWAKFPEGESTPSRYHPLICHLIDVAAVTQSMWLEVLPLWTRRHVAQRLGLDDDATCRWISFLGGGHDVGKACPPFQFRKETPLKLRQKIIEAGLTCPRSLDHVPHGVVTAHALAVALQSSFGFPPDIATMLATSVGGHHGIFPSLGQTKKKNLPIARLGNDGWSNARLKLLRALGDLLGVFHAERPKQIDTATAMWLAGFVSVADWIGSNDKFFRYAVPDLLVAPPDNLSAYLALAKARSGEALERLGWRGWMPAQHVLPFAGVDNSLFPHLPGPVAVQKKVIDLAACCSGPVLTIIEAPMGEGKTEAAMYLADYWSVTQGQRGYFFALPSQATSNQMFGRVQEFLARRYPVDIVNLQLLHGHAALSDEFRLLRKYANHLFDPGGVYDDTKDGSTVPSVVAAEWFTHRKRGLLAPFGVGTIDQTLLAALKTRHVFVRLFGLAGKTVIVDEVHAYDSYMSRLLEQLLKWLGALGCSVVLLSATLPAGRRQVLIEAYLRGAAPGVDLTPRDLSEAYPRITWVQATKGGLTSTHHVPASQRSSKSIAIREIDGRLPTVADGTFPLGQLLHKELRNGGCAAIVCNTVGRAQAIYQALKTYIRDCGDVNVELLLLHARYPFGERDRREKDVLRRFGKPTTAEDGTEIPSQRPHRSILVATQIIEQSLDIDFDMMVTDLAPVDLILQRTGRLQRHGHAIKRPLRFKDKPTLWVCIPETDDVGVPNFVRYDSIVYDNHVLLRSWWELRKLFARRDLDQRGPMLEVPAMIEALIKAVYGEEHVCPDDVPPEWGEWWDKTRNQQEEDIRRSEQEAEYRCIGDPGDDVPLDALIGMTREEDEPELPLARQALTRLTEPSVSIVLLYGSRERPTLEPDGEGAFNPALPPTMDLTEQLLYRSLPVKDKRVVGLLSREDQPRGWRREALLRHHRAVYLNTENRASVGRYVLGLDQELGLLIEDPGKGLL